MSSENQDEERDSAEAAGEEEGRSEGYGEPSPEPADLGNQQRARLAEDRLAEVLGAYRALRTDTEAYRERLTRNVERRFEQRRDRLLLKFIDILDNLDRALHAAEATAADEALIQGLILVRTHLLQTLRDEGLERIPVLGLTYDPAVSEAVDTQAVDDAEQHHVVVKELMRGYRLMGRIARAARVVVGEYAGASETQTTPAPVAAAPEPPGLSTEEEQGPSLEDIISRAEAQEALFPTAFAPDEKKD